MISDKGDIMLDEDDIANRLYDEMKDKGYKDYNDMMWQKSFEQATRDYEHKLACPYDY